MRNTTLILLTIVLACCLIVTQGALAGSPPPAGAYPTGVPAPRVVPGKEYSHHMDIDAQAVPDPMQNLAWDGTGNAWDTFDYSTANQWEQGTNVDAIANIQDRFFHEVVNDQVALLVTIDDGAATAAVVPSDYENIHYQTAGPGSVAGIWAQGVIPGVPATSDIHTQAVQAAQLADPNHQQRWLSPTGIEVWGPEVFPNPTGGGPGIGDDAIMFSTNDEWAPGGVAKPAVWKFDPTNNIVFPYIMADQIRLAIDNAGQNLVQNNIEIDLDGMMTYDMEKDDRFGPGDSIMFTVHSVPTPTGGGFLLDGGEIWVWHFDQGPNSAQFLNHGGVPWNTANSVIGVFPNVMGQENVGGLEAVPEPATMSMLILGGLALLRRKRRKM
ncbi:MAG: PEP-CTERM sorting domain-containing protein [Phycisphaerales bacterium]|nr:PEP-CTERM sorting domain-containing protein [Phycisphaerales bacterium]